MSKEEALKVISEAVELANKAGVFNLQQSTIVYNALVVLRKEYQKEDQPKAKTKEESK